MKYNKESGIFHFFIMQKIKEKINDSCNNIIKRVEVKEVLYNNGIPINLHQDFLKEMEKFKLIKIKDKQNIRILK